MTCYTATIMDIAADDNFFIEEPQKLRNNFFSKDRSIQMELLNHHENISKRKENSCRIAYNKKHLQHLQQHHHLQLQQTTNINPTTTTAMPTSYITRLEILCQATYNTDDISMAKRAVDTLVSASKSGCCFLERYIVMLLNFCSKKHLPISEEDNTMKIKIELLNRVLLVDFDRQQLTENLRRPEYKLSSVNDIIQLLQRVQGMLDYREQTAINWLLVIVDAYFVDLATADEAVSLIDQISAHINFRCALMRQTESTKSILKSVVESLEVNKEISGSKINSITNQRHKRPHYSIEQVEI